MTSLIESLYAFRVWRDDLTSNHQQTEMGHIKKPRVDEPVQYGFEPNFWVEYPSGLVDITRSHRLQRDGQPAELTPATQWEVAADGERMLRLAKKSTAIVIVDMQKYVSEMVN